MDIDFEAARKHLKQARKFLQGNDGACHDMAGALDLMIINLAVAECSSFRALSPFRRSKHAEARDADPVQALDSFE
ncbi:hypothetical protein [Mesorhizobium sp. A556]